MAINLDSVFERSIRTRHNEQKVKYLRFLESMNMTKVSSDGGILADKQRGGE